MDLRAATEGDLPLINEICNHYVQASPAIYQLEPFTADERTVLIATKSLKSSYGGVSNFRFHEANRSTGITLDRYNTAKSTLIGKKLLNAAGAVTIEGRNLAGSARL